MNRVNVVAHLEKCRLFVKKSGKLLTTIRIDNEFLTSISKDWANVHNINFVPIVPYEHDSVRMVERLHRTLQKRVVKLLAFKLHLNSAYWGLAYMDSIDLYNITSSKSDSNLTPYSSW